MALAGSPAPFGALLKRYRRTAGLTQEAVAERAQLSVRAVSALERGVNRAPRRATLDLLATALALPPHEKAALEGAAWPEPPTGGGPPIGAAPRLPAALTSFIGRERALAEITRLLRSGADAGGPAAAASGSRDTSGIRLLTLTGPGGTGKTRLALQAAHALLDAYADGVWLTELAALADPALVAQTVAGTLGVAEEPGRPLQLTLGDALRAKRVLLVLDNCEHLVEAAAGLAETLLRACPVLSILATSREPLGVPGEVVWRVPPLELPPRLRSDAAAASTEDILHSEAVRLFADRAAAALPGLELTRDNAALIANVCQRLDGIPLAIELAAARLRHLPLADLAARLEDRFQVLTGGSRTALPRQQTLRATVEWSYDLLSEPERTLFRRLAVFAGGFTLEAAQTVASGQWPAANAPPPTRDPAPGHAALTTDHGPPITPEAVLDLVGRLVDRSLVLAEPVTGGARDGASFRMLETLRQYARERLEAAGEAAAVEGRHAQYFAALAEAAEPHLLGPGQVEAIRRLDDAQENVRAALGWCVRSGEAVLGLRLGGALWRYWIACGHESEARDWLARLLALRPGGHDARPDPSSAAAGAKALACAGILASWQGDLAAAQAYLEECIAVGREIGAHQSVVNGLFGLARVARLRGDLPAAGALLEEGKQLARAHGDDWGLAQIFMGLGILEGERDLAAARAAFEESRALFRRLGDAQRVAEVSSWLGRLGLRSGDPAAARALIEEALAIHRRTGGRRGVALTLGNLGRVALAEGNLAAAETHFRESLRSLVSLGLREPVAAVLWNLAAVDARRGRAERALRLGGAAAALVEALGAVPRGLVRDEVEQSLETARRTLGAAAAEAAWAAGAAMATDEVIAEALGASPATSAPAAPAAPAKAVATRARLRDAPAWASPAARAAGLSKREWDVLALLAQGASNRAVAEALHISPHTAARHVAGILNKLGAESRGAAVARALGHPSGAPSGVAPAAGEGSAGHD